MLAVVVEVALVAQQRGVGGGGGGALEALRGTAQMQMLRRAVMANAELLGPMLQVSLGSARVPHVAKVETSVIG
jgi:hypothetical protein